MPKRAGFREAVLACVVALFGAAALGGFFVGVVQGIDRADTFSWMVIAEVLGRGIVMSIYGDSDY